MLNPLLLTPWTQSTSLFLSSLSLSLSFFLLSLPSFFSLSLSADHYYGSLPVKNTTLVVAVKFTLLGICCLLFCVNTLTNCLLFTCTPFAEVPSTVTNGLLPPTNLTTSNAHSGAYDHLLPPSKGKSSSIRQLLHRSRLPSSNKDEGLLTWRFLGSTKIQGANLTRRSCLLMLCAG